MVIKSKRKDNVSCAQIKDKNGILQANPEIKANILNDQFSSVDKPSMKTPPQKTMDDIVISPLGIQKLLSKIKPFKATGPDNIPPFILKELSHEIAPIFSILFQASLFQSKLPADWKIAHVAPIFKKGDPLLASNYRPVSLTSIPSKIMEHIVYSQIMKHLHSKQHFMQQPTWLQTKQIM